MQKDKTYHVQRTKPCADCGQKALGVTAATTLDVLEEWGISPEDGATIVELGVRATKDSDRISVLTMALAASSERYTAAIKSLEEAELALEKAHEEIDYLEEQYNNVVEAFEGSYSVAAGDAEGDE